MCTALLKYERRPATSQQCCPILVSLERNAALCCSRRNAIAYELVLILSLLCKLCKSASVGVAQQDSAGLLVKGTKTWEVKTTKCICVKVGESIDIASNCKGTGSKKYEILGDVQFDGSIAVDTHILKATFEKHRMSPDDVKRQLSKWKKPADGVYYAWVFKNANQWQQPVSIPLCPGAPPRLAQHPC